MENDDLLATLSALEPKLHQVDQSTPVAQIEALLHPDFEEFGRSGRLNSIRKSRPVNSQPFSAVTATTGFHMGQRNNNTRQPRRTSKVGAGIAIGTGIGAALGSALGNMGTGLGIGIAIGAAIGVTLDKKDRERRRLDGSSDDK